ncbi:hypothetical protein RB653_009602 [Dictyostelium firmibasis]|uniref:DH domain-containing protein n=1 Tax=Dictyostelium firmibasis TaxID=79012 RepID=A0AAN7U5B1_9MYCE
MGNTNSTASNINNNNNNNNGKNDEDESTKKKRELILEEIIQTEKSYVTYLSAIQEVYIDPLRSGQYKSLIKEDHIKSIFLTEDLLKFHVEFFTELAICYNSFSWSNDILPPNSLTKTTVTTNQNRLSTVTTTTTTFSSPNSKPQKLKEITSLESTVAITSIFNKNQENFKMYSNYIIGYDASVTLLARLRKKKDFSNFLEKCRNDSRCNGLDLNSILIMPVQRLPRYVLLLSELIKQTPPNHPNIKLLNKCLKGIKEVTSFINEAKRDDDNQIKTQQLQETIIEKVNIYESGRKYILDGEFFIHSIYPLKEEDALLKRLKKYRSSIKGGKSSNDLTEQWVFPDEFKVSKETTYYSFNDCLLLLQKGQKSILSLKSANRVWNIIDVSLSSKIRVIDVLDIFNFTNSILLFMEKSIYFVQLKNIDKEKFIKTLLMTKATSDWKDLDNDNNNNNNSNNTIATDDLPSVLTLRPVTESSGSKGFFSNLTSSTTLAASSSSSSSSQNHKKSQSTTTPTKNNGKLQNKTSPSQSNPPPPRKSTIFASSEKKS